MTVSLLEQPDKNRYCAHILSYVPVRKSASIDIIEDRTKLYNVNIRFNLPAAIQSARLVPEGTLLKVQDAAVTIPEINGYAILELNY